MTQRITYDETKTMFGENARKLAQSSITLAMRRQNGRQSDEADQILKSYLDGKFGTHDKDTNWVTGLNYKNGMSPEKKMLLMLGRKGSDVKDGGVVGIGSRALDLNEELVQKDMVHTYLSDDAEFIVQVQRNTGKVQERITKRTISNKTLGLDEHGKPLPVEKKDAPDKKAAPAKQEKKDAPKKKAAPAKKANPAKKLTAAQQQKALAEKRKENDAKQDAA